MDKIEKLAQVLTSQGYTVNCFNDKKEAASFLNAELDNRTIGIGGSETVSEMGLFEMLSSHNKVIWHHKAPENMTVLEARKAAAKASVYISSVNAISLTGDIVNIDGTGNRVSAISFGPDDIYFVVGKNKITEDLESAMFRAKNVAAPLNAKRLKLKTPCAIKGDKCYDCKCPDRICRSYSILSQKPSGANYHVVLINENLGF